MKLLQNLTETLNTAQLLNPDYIATLKDFHEQLQRKQELISGLDAKILETVTDDEEIEAEVLQTEEINSSISSAKAKITERLKTTVITEVSTAVRNTSSTGPQVTRLPKLELPQFSGDPLHWQSFWDCFEAAVHNNATLTGVQKLTYLRVQLQGDAARIIAVFQLTNDNYNNSVSLLKERYGQIHEQVDAHMQAFVDPVPFST